MPWQKQLCFQTSGEDGSFRLPVQHCKYIPDVLIGTGKQIIVQYNMSLSDRQFPENTALSHRHSTKPAVVRTTSGGNDIPLFQIHTGNKVAARMVKGRASHKDRHTQIAPRLCKNFCFRQIVGSPSTNSNPILTFPGSLSLSLPLSFE